MGGKRNEGGSESASVGVILDISAGNRKTANQAEEILSLPGACAVLCRIDVNRLAHLHSEAIAAAFDNRFDVSFLAHLVRKHKTRGQRDIHLCEGAVWAFHSAPPEPCRDLEP